MSDNWIRLVPDDPTYVPNKIQIGVALNRFWDVAPDSDEIRCEVSDDVRFFDCGSNFLRVSCPLCQSEISLEWWDARMNDDLVGRGFKLRKYRTPCCGESVTLHELRCDWVQSFGRFLLDAMNPNIGKLDEKLVAEFEGILGSKLRVIYQHI